MILICICGNLHFHKSVAAFIEGDVFRIVVPLDDSYLDEGSTLNLQDDIQTDDLNKPLDIKIMDVMQKNPTITQKEIAGLLQVNTNTLKYRILRLRKAGKIERVGSPQKGQWIVK